MPHYISYRVTCLLPQHGSHPQARWHVWHRYREFYDLRINLIKANRRVADFAFPVRRWFSGMAAETVSERKQGWASFLENAAKACETPEEAAFLDAFLRCNEHSHPPRSPKPWARQKGSVGARKSSEVGVLGAMSSLQGTPPSPLRYGGAITETDTLHHKTTDDIEFANTLRRNDTFGQLALAALDSSVHGRSSAKGPSRSPDSAVSSSLANAAGANGGTDDGLTDGAVSGAILTEFGTPDVRQGVMSARSRRQGRGRKERGKAGERERPSLATQGGA